MEAHRLAAYFPIMEGEKFDKFVEDIKLNGQLEPIVTFKGEILDGVNRFKACQFLGIEPMFKEYKGADPLHYVISVNVHRRHLSESQLGIISNEMLPEFEKEAKKRQGNYSGTTGPEVDTLVIDSEGFARAREQVAKEFGIGGRTVGRAKRIMEKASPEKVELIKRGKESLFSVDKELKIEAEKERKEKAISEGRTQKTEIEMRIEEQQYIQALESIISKLPKQPPVDWSDKFFGIAQGYANIIINRLEVFNG